MQQLCRHAGTAEPCELWTHERWQHLPSHLLVIRRALSTTSGLYNTHKTVIVWGGLLYDCGATFIDLFSSTIGKKTVQSRTKISTKLTGKRQDVSAGCAGLPGRMRTSGNHFTSAAKHVEGAHGPATVVEMCGEPPPFPTHTAHIKLPTLPTANNSPVLVFSVLRKTSLRTSRTLDTICQV